MKTFCLDTNAILDFCYRFYPQSIFDKLWELLEAVILARQIQFIITRHIYNELTAKIDKMNYDKSVFDDFINRFDVQIIDDYESQLAQLKARLSAIAKNVALIKLNNLDNDLSNICVSIKHHSTVITSEQGFDEDITKATNIRDLKIPDICHYFNVDCANWLLVFTTIGFKS